MTTGVRKYVLGLRSFRQGCIILLILYFGCGGTDSRVERSMYYWRTVFSLPPSVLGKLDKASVRTLYVRFFDVDRPDGSPAAFPVGSGVFREPPPPEFEIIPVVFITVRAMRNTPPDSAVALALSILSEVDSITSNAGISFNELQLDCDWTPATRENFFRIADTLRGEMHRRRGALSATIRLHQVKYPDRTGVPPVDRGMVMFYNMGNMRTDPEHHSIYRNEDARRYADFLGSYELPLDGALPIFYWTLHFRGGRAIGILNKTGADDLRAAGGVRDEGNGIFTATRSLFVRSAFVASGDVLKVEEVPPGLCLAAARQLAGRLRPESRRIALFECDSLYLSRYENDDIEEIFSAFR